MSDVMLHGVLRMPPELWDGGELDVVQRHQRYLEASQRIKDGEREIERLHEALKVANAQAERFEREWYLRGDALDNLQTQAIRDIAPGWVSVPEVEWDSIMAQNPVVPAEGDASPPAIIAEPGALLGAKHFGMKISADGVLGRIRDGHRSDGLDYVCGEMLRHMEEMARRFYAGDVKAVDEFLQLYALDEGRPDPMLGNGQNM